MQLVNKVTLFLELLLDNMGKQNNDTGIFNINFSSYKKTD